MLRGSTQASKLAARFASFNFRLLTGLFLILFLGRIAASQGSPTYLDMHDFGGVITYKDGSTGPDGGSPNAVVFDNSGNIFGVAGGGAYGEGMIWEITASGSYLDLHDFGATFFTGVSDMSGAGPLGIAIDRNGNLFGVTYEGGRYNGLYGGGIVWKLDTSGRFSDIHDFGGPVLNADGSMGVDGINPAAGLTIDGSGNLFGTAKYGGPNGSGIVWSLSTSGAYKDLHDFGGQVNAPDGSSYYDASLPQGVPTLDSSGKLWGTATVGGRLGSGILWYISPSGAYTDFHDFGGPITFSGGTIGLDGIVSGNIVFDSSGNIFGIEGTGLQNYGCIWKITPDGTFTDLHDFNGYDDLGLDGTGPSMITMDASGNLFGIATNGGVNGYTGSQGGTLWEMTPQGAFQVLHNFGGTVYNSGAQAVPDGVLPSSLAFDPTGNLFGVTNQGGNIDPSDGGFGILWSYNTNSVSSVSLSPGSVIAGQSSTAKVMLAGPAPSGGLQVFFTSSSASVTLQPAVNVPAGAQTATVPIVTNGVDNITNATVTASYGTLSASSTLVVSNAVLTSISLSSNSIVAGNGLTGTVTLNGPAGPSGASVALSASSGSVQVPSSATIPFGSKSVSFPVSTSGIASQSVQFITASSGSASQSASLTLTLPAPSSISFNPDIVAGGTTSTGTVILSGKAGSKGVIVILSSNSTSAIPASSVTIQPGSSTGAFTIKTLAVSSPLTAIITAQANGLSATSGITLSPPWISSIAVNPLVAIGGTSATGSVSLQGNAPKSGITIKLSSDTAAVTVPATVTIPSGKSTASFTVKTTAVGQKVTAKLTAAQSTHLETCSLSVSAPTLTAVSLKPQTAVGGATVPGTVTLSSIAPTGGLVISLSSNSNLVTVPSSVTVAAGKSIGMFTVLSKPVNTTTTVAISAILGGTTQLANLVVSAPTIKTLTTSPSSVHGGKSATAMITLSSAAASGGFVVTLQSNQSAVTVPYSVTVPSGTTKATFNIQTTSVGSKTTATITALSNGSSKTATLVVQ